MIFKGKLFGKPIKSRKGLKKKQIKLYILIVFTLVVVAVIMLFSALDSRFFPAAVNIATINAQASINQFINESVDQVMSKLSLKSEDFYTKSLDNNGKINSLSANTLLINDICGKLAVEISNRLISEKPEVVSIPIGSLLGINVLANIGPDYKVEILNSGRTSVDYETQFVSAGINQINFQIWLKVESSIQIVNPMQNKELVITRKVALVNTIINGDVPAGIYQFK